MADRLHLIRMQNATTAVILPSLPASDYSQKPRRACDQYGERKTDGILEYTGLIQRDPRYCLANSKQRQVLWGCRAPRQFTSSTWWSFCEHQGGNRAISEQDSNRSHDTPRETWASKYLRGVLKLDSVAAFEQVKKRAKGFWELSALQCKNNTSKWRKHLHRCENKYFTPNMLEIQKMQVNADKQTTLTMSWLYDSNQSSCSLDACDPDSYNMCSEAFVGI